MLFTIVMSGVLKPLAALFTSKGPTIIKDTGISGEATDLNWSASGCSSQMDEWALGSPAVNVNELTQMLSLDAKRSVEVVPSELSPIFGAMAGSL